MSKRLLNTALSLVIAGFFIWLALRNIDTGELWTQIRGVNYSWLPFFIVVMMLSHFLRAERWRLLLKERDRNINRSTLFAGVMLGYVVNNIVPRLGEVSRPVYVAKKENISSGNLLGTIVVERMVDLSTMLFLIFFTAFYLISDVQTVEKIFGTENWTWHTYALVPAALLAMIGGIWLLYKVLAVMEQKQAIENPFFLKLLKAARSFGEGLVSVKNVTSWPVFFLLTAGIWTGYILMAYLPFYMMDLQDAFHLDLADAVVVTMVSSVGISIPTPAGIGSYHLLIQQSLRLLYGVPAVTALTYATVAHAVTVILIFIAGPLSLWWDKYYTLNHSAAR